MAKTACIDITAWRVLFDNEDSLEVNVFAAGDETPVTDVISAEQADNFTSAITWDYDDPGDVTHPATITNQQTIRDGEILIAHDGRQFRISITEVLLPWSSLTRAQFHSYDSGKIIAGVKHEILTDLGLENHETYQFDSLDAVLECATAFTAIPGMKRVRVVTHRGEYKGMKTLAEWKAEDNG